MKKVKIEILTNNLGCSKCENAMRIIDGVIEKYADKIEVLKTDIIKNPEKLGEFGIMSTPAIIINGKLEFEGTPDKEELDKKIQEILK